MGTAPIRWTHGWRGAAVAFAFFLLITPIFLRPLFDFAHLHNRLQTRDSVLIAAIMDHSARGMVGLADFWDFGIFYPLERSLCLSEPMVSPAILLMPLLLLGAWPLALNVWILISWIGQAMAAWWFLRLRGAGFLASLLGGFLVAYCPDRLWHAAGHAHLYFQAGFILSVIFLQRAFAPSASRWWAAGFGLTFLFQVFCGFYLTVLYGLWLMVMGPVAIWVGAGGCWRNVLQGLKRQGLVLCAGPILTGLLLMPMVGVYSEYGKDFPQNTLESVAMGSATRRGYLMPPADSERIMTPAGWLALKREGFNAATSEDCQYLGVVTVGLLLVGVALGGAALWRERRLSPGAVMVLGLVLVGLVGVVLSIGPLWGRTRLPYGYLYAWVDQIRFFRAPARFAFLVGWSASLLAAISLDQLSGWFSTKTKHAARLSALVFAIALIDFLPINPGIYRIWCGRDAVSEHLTAHPDPYVSVPVDSNQLMVWLGHSKVPTANGFSGYSPENRFSQLLYFQRSFPGPESLALMREWGVDHVLVHDYLDEETKAKAAASPWLSQVWTGRGGTMYRVTGSDWTVAKVRELHAPPPVDKPLVLLESGFPTGITGFRQAGFEAVVRDRTWTASYPTGQLHFYFPPEKFTRLPYDYLVLRVAIDNWYQLNEPGALYWDTPARPGWGEDRKAEFVLKADGTVQTIRIPLGEIVAWAADPQPLSMRLDVSHRIGDRVTLEYIGFE